MPPLVDVEFYNNNLKTEFCKVIIKKIVDKTLLNGILFAIILVKLLRKYKMELFNLSETGERLGISRAAVQERIDSGSMVAIKKLNDKRYKHYIPEATLDFNPKKSKSTKPKIITVNNLKGGTGKTTISVNLSTMLNLFGKKVLLVDMDPQSNSTKTFLKKNQIKMSIKDLLELYTKKMRVGEEDIKKSIHKVVFENVTISLMPTELSMSRVVEYLRNVSNTAITKLHNILEKIKDEYDFIVIDTPPNASIIMQMSLFASDMVIIVTEPEEYAVEGMVDLMDEINLVKDEMSDLRAADSTIDIHAIVINKMENINIHRDYHKEIEMIASRYNISNIYTVPKSVKIKEAQALQLPLLEYKDELDSGFKAAEPIFMMAYNLVTKG